MKHVHIFRPGRYRAADGRLVEFSEADLDATVAAYSPALHRAPVVIGHPATDDPAYGWVKSLRRVADGIEAEITHIHPAFAEATQAGRYQNVSACFYEPGIDGNPVKDVYYLKHVGALGAMPPAVKGLRSMQFSESEVGTVEFSESDLASGQQIEADLWRNLREWLIAQHGVEVADQVVPSWALEAVRDSASEAAKEAPANDAAVEAVKEEQQAENAEAAKPETAAFAEKAPESALAQQNAQLREELARLQAQQADKAKAATHASNVAFAEKLVARGMKPVHVDAVVKALDTASGGQLAFAEGGTSLAETLRGVLEGLTASVSFSEQATVARAAPAAINPLTADAEARSQKKS